jgi:hypothetical protein
MTSIVKRVFDFSRAAATPMLARFALATVICSFAAVASAQAPIPSSSTPTLHGGTPVNGSAVLGEVGYAALRGSFYTGGADRDFGIELAAPTFGGDTLPGYAQSLGIDVRAPFRFLLSRWPKANGSFKVGPYFGAGRACFHRGYNGRRGECDARTVSLGANFGYVTDIALPKIFKLIVGIEQQMGLLHVGVRDGGKDNAFAAATWLDLGLEALWRNMFFTLIINAGAQYGSNDIYYRDHALFRQMFGFGYKFR